MGAPDPLPLAAGGFSFSPQPPDRHGYVFASRNSERSKIEKTRIRHWVILYGENQKRITIFKYRSK